MTLFGHYKGADFLAMKLEPREWLIEGLIRKKDAVILVGNEKSGKSLIINQLICSLTSQHDFLDTYRVPTPAKTTLLHLEGEIEDDQDRFKRMIRALDINEELFHYAFLAPLELQSRNTTFTLRDEIKKFHTPDIIIIDPIYFAFAGKLGDDEVVRKFLGNMRILKDSFQCALLLVHHTHKTKWDYTGTIIDEGDEALFGSKLLKAFPDHILFFDYKKDKGIRVLSCSTQRSGDIVNQCLLKLNQPDPLYFEITEKDLSKEVMIIDFLKQPECRAGMNAEEIMTTLKLKRNAFYNSIKQPLIRGELEKVEGTRPIKYRYKWELSRKG